MVLWSKQTSLILVRGMIDNFIFYLHPVSFALEDFGIDHLQNEKNSPQSKRTNDPKIPDGGGG
jgi:hypothetical protein